MNQYKRLLSNTFIFAVGTFSSKILVILMLRFYTGVLTQDEMGVADLIIKTTSILYPVVSLSIGQAVIRYGLERRRRKPDVFTIGLLTVACGFLISLPFNPLLKLVHYNTSAGAAGSLLDYRILIYVYVLTSCTQNVCGQFIRAIGYVRLYAIDGLVRKGLLECKQGKGTFVSHHKLQRNMKKLQSFSDMCRQMGMKPGARMVENHLVPASAPIARRLGVDAGSSVIYISRLRLADGVPVQIEKSYFPLSYAFLLEAKFDDNSLFDYLRKSRGVWVASSEKSIEVCRVTKEEAALLNIQKGDLQLCVKSTAFDANEQVLYAGVQIINGDLFSLYVYESEQ